jgi:hypothetical protein
MTRDLRRVIVRQGRMELMSPLMPVSPVQGSANGDDLARLSACVKPDGQRPTVA